MYRYELIKYYAGATVEVVRHIPRRYRRESSGIRVKKSKEDIRKANMVQAARKLARKINANFKPGDLHIVLTYRRENKPDRQQAQEYLKKFMDGLRTRYRKAGRILKYILVTEYKARSIHHHLIVNHVNDGAETTADYVRKLWKTRGSPHFTPLYDNAEYQTLAEYLIKETERTFREPDSPVKQRFSCSRNLVNPKERRKTIKAVRLWREEPAPPPGYYIDKDSVYNGWDKMGFPYQRYTLIKLSPKETDWPPDVWVPPKKKRRKSHVQGKHKNRREAQ